jgi:hypothetical protein
MRWRSFDGIVFIFNNKCGSMRKELLTGGFNIVVVVLEKGVMLCFVLDLQSFAYLCHDSTGRVARLELVR